MSDTLKLITQQVRERLTKGGLDKDALNKPGAHVVVAGEPNELHVLVKDSKPNKAIDTLAAQIEGAGNASRPLTVKESPTTLDLGELGQWRDFVVSGVSPTDPVRASGEPLALYLVGNAKDPDAPAPFGASLDLSFVVEQLLNRGEVHVRPIPPGKRGDKEFVEVGNTTRQALRPLLGRVVDATVAASEIDEAMTRLREINNGAVEAGIVGLALTLGVASSAVRLTRPDMRSEAPAQAPQGVEGLSEATSSYLRMQGLTPPDNKPTADWAESTIDALPADVPDAVAREVRLLMVALRDRATQDASNEAMSLLFGDAAPAPAKQENVVAGASRFAQFRAYRVAQLRTGLEDLDVPEQKINQLAELMTQALMASERPSIVIIAGPADSAADRMMALATQMVGKTPLNIDRGQLADPRFAGIYGHINNVSTTGLALLSKSNLDKHRGKGSHVPIVVENLAVVGESAPENTRGEVLQRWLELVSEMSRSGKASVWDRDAGGMAESRLSNSVFLMRWVGEPGELERILSAKPNLRHLVARTVGSENLAPVAALTYWEQELSRELTAQGLPQGVRVEIGGGLRAAFTELFTRESATAFERFHERLLAELSAAAKAAPAGHYVVDWSSELTRSEPGKIMNGDEVSAEHYYGFRLGDAAESPALHFDASESLDDLLARAQRADELAQEVDRLRGQLAKLKKSPGTV